MVRYTQNDCSLGPAGGSYSYILWFVYLNSPESTSLINFINPLK